MLPFTVFIVFPKATCSRVKEEDPIFSLVETAAPLNVSFTSLPPTSQNGSEKAENKSGAPPVTALNVQTPMPAFQAMANPPVEIVCPLKPAFGIKSSNPSSPTDNSTLDPAGFRTGCPLSTNPENPCSIADSSAFIADAGVATNDSDLDSSIDEIAFPNPRLTTTWFKLSAGVRALQKQSAGLFPDRIRNMTAPTLYIS